MMKSAPAAPGPTAPSTTAPATAVASANPYGSSGSCKSRIMIHERFAQLSAAYPDDIDRIEAEEKRVSELLRYQEYYELETTKEFLALCRQEIVKARLKLATGRALSEEQREEVWQFIEAREWFMKMVAKNYSAQQEMIDQELENELRR
jgi:hypothetical protein